jgi:hypothetical protein
MQQTDSAQASACGSFMACLASIFSGRLLGTAGGSSEVDRQTHRRAADQSPSTSRALGRARSLLLFFTRSLFCGTSRMQFGLGIQDRGIGSVFGSDV